MIPVTDPRSNAPYAMREWLRETALQVTLMSQAPRVLSVDALHARCVGLVVEFDRTLAAAGVDDVARKDATLAQCALFDEAALVYLQGEERTTWERQPIQVQRFGRHDAGDAVYERIEQRMGESPARIDVLECFATILGLGFKGRHALDDMARQSVIARLDALIAPHRAPAGTAFIVDASRGRDLRWLSPLAVAAMACIAAVVTYVVCARSLDTELAALFAAAP